MTWECPLIGLGHFAGLRERDSLTVTVVTCGPSAVLSVPFSVDVRHIMDTPREAMLMQDIVFLSFAFFLSCRHFEPLTVLLLLFS